MLHRRSCQMTFCIVLLRKRYTRHPLENPTEDFEQGTLGGFVSWFRG